jgi:NADH-quinone oxidoreductase subunit M
MKEAMAIMLSCYFETDIVWFKNWNIHYHIGVDGISIAMILLTAFVVLAGVLVSWNQEINYREFFFLLILLSAGCLWIFYIAGLIYFIFLFRISCNT